MAAGPAVNKHINDTLIEVHINYCIHDQWLEINFSCATPLTLPLQRTLSLAHEVICQFFHCWPWPL